MRGAKLYQKGKCKIGNSIRKKKEEESNAYTLYTIYNVDLMKTKNPLPSDITF